MADYLNNNFSGINVSESAGNPFQLDINYHGFTASPLLGTPEGLSVYVDGVRVNESFGDTVNWDLIPESAISTVSLMSGSNPVFGLNTLGGALVGADQERPRQSGHRDRGLRRLVRPALVPGRDRRGVGPFDYFFTGNYFDETGWRDLSPTRVWQGFGKVGWQTEKTDIDLSYTYADTSLYGNGATPLSMLDYRREPSYTPDFTHNLLNFVNLTGTQFLTDTAAAVGQCVLPPPDHRQHQRQHQRQLSGRRTTPGRRSTAARRRRTAPRSPTAPRGQNAGLAPAAAHRRLRPAADRFAGSCSAGRTRPSSAPTTTTREDTFAQAFQYGGIGAESHADLRGESAQQRDRHLARRQQQDLRRLLHRHALAERAAPRHGVGALQRNTETLNGYSVDTDVGDVGAGFDEPSPLAGDHTFSRVNPSIGFTFTPTDALTYYANYNEASRAPTVIELGCANPAQPCGLPNDFASDPDLKQVVARTFEIGLRGNLPDQRLNWSADVFHTVNSNDIQFIATSTNSGYFDNVGSTRRQGLDLALGGKQGGLQLAPGVQLRRCDLPVGLRRSTPHPTAPPMPTATSWCSPGDRIPLIPRHTGRLVLDYDRPAVGHRRQR